MKINDVVPSTIVTPEAKDLRQNVNKSENSGKAVQPKNDSSAINTWQKDILLQAIDVLENNIQPDNSHPLTRSDYRPIDNFHEAMIELNFLKNPQFKAEAFKAQANLNPQDVSSLFMGN